jgi:hypothetical protein
MSIPQWYKDGETEYFHSGEKQKGMKTCIPFLESLSIGYLLRTSINIYIKKNHNNSISIDYDDEFDSTLLPPVSLRPLQFGSTIPRPAGHSDLNLVWQATWGWQTPKGYSSLVTHPLNRSDLPFTTTSGMLDSDKYISAGNLSFFLKEDFEGLIPKNTPFAQIIPIKRNSWNGVVSTELVEKANKIEKDGHDGGYKKYMWERKKYKMEIKNER